MVASWAHHLHCSERGRGSPWGTAPAFRLAAEAMGLRRCDIWADTIAKLSMQLQPFEDKGCGGHFAEIGFAVE